MLRVAVKSIILCDIMLSLAMLNVTLLKVMAPLY
jgi:hypothetical protein